MLARPYIQEERRTQARSRSLLGLRASKGMRRRRFGGAAARADEGAELI